MKQTTKDQDWKEAIIDELICLHIYNESHEQNPHKAIHDAISWNVEVALDPQVSSDAQALIDRGAAAEREACAKIVDHILKEGGGTYGDAIRARNQQ